MIQLRKPNEEMQICSFLWVYYGFPTSCYEGKNVEEVRFKSGYEMGLTDDSEVDCACGIPDSGVGMALGYAEGKGVPYHRAIAKYTPTWPRSFTPSNQAMRNLVAKMKLIPNRAMLEGKRLLFCDDSIVRGTQLSDNVKVLYDYGAREVHMRIACPPLIYGCKYIGFTSSKSDLELITRKIIGELEGDPNANLEKYATTDSPEYKAMVEVIRKRFGLTSLKFNTIEQVNEYDNTPSQRDGTYQFGIVKLIGNVLSTAKNYCPELVNQFLQQDVACLPFPGINSYRDSLLNYNPSGESLQDVLTHKFGNFLIFSLVNVEAIDNFSVEAIAAASRSKDVFAWFEQVVKILIRHLFIK